MLGFQVKHVDYYYSYRYKHYSSYVTSTKLTDWSDDYFLTTLSIGYLHK
jgi:hypothetical protein